MKPWLREGTMAKMREVILGQSELEVQRKFNEWQKRMAGRVSEVDGRLERIKRPQGSGKVAGVDTVEKSTEIIWSGGLRPILPNCRSCCGSPKGIESWSYRKNKAD